MWCFVKRKTQTDHLDAGIWFLASAECVSYRVQIERRRRDGNGQVAACSTAALPCRDNLIMKKEIF